MFTKLEKRLIVAFLCVTVALGLGVYAVNNNTLTMDTLSAFIACWALGLIVFFGAICAHIILSKKCNDGVRRIIVKDY